MARLPCAENPFQARAPWSDLAANPPVMYQSEKGSDPRGTSAWRDLRTGRSLTGTTWGAGVVDYSARDPRVYVEYPVSPSWWRAPKLDGGRRVLTYLLHPEKWDWRASPVVNARGFLVNVNDGQPANNLGYARRLIYNVPVRLENNPMKWENPRGWFAAYGHVTACDRAGTIEVYGKGLVPVYEAIVVHWPGEAPGGKPLLR